MTTLFQPTQEVKREGKKQIRKLKKEKFRGLHRNVGASRFNGPYGRQGYVLVRSNQGDRLDGNESVADSFRNDLVGFKSWSGRILGAFLPFYVCQKKPPVGKRTRYPGFERTVPLSACLQLFSSCIQGSSESVQEFAARINKLGTQIFQSSNTAQNTAVRNANDQLLQSRFIRRNDIRRFVLARDPNNLEESINAALIEEQNVKLNQIANDERTGLSPSQTETSVISALTNKLQEINLRVERLQEASSVTARKTGGDLFRRRETVFKCFYSGFQGHRQAECRKRGWTNVKPITSSPGKRRERIFCFPSPKHSFFRPATCPFPRIGFSR
ncbi:hypothetical protein TNCV_1737971 [Trichonephila clavipes]|nr:hypothetical protein TNCV_1737971 [Trichonephila clavipes]